MYFGWMGLVIRILRVPIFPVFRIPFGRKSGKTTEKHFSALKYCSSTMATKELGKVPLDRF